MKHDLLNDLEFKIMTSNETMDLFIRLSGNMAYRLIFFKQGKTYKMDWNTTEVIDNRVYSSSDSYAGNFGTELHLAITDYMKQLGWFDLVTENV